jgi:hypothetical protein
MREISPNDLEVEIVREIRKWRDKLIMNQGDSLLSEMDAADAAGLASAIALDIIRPGIEVIGAWDIHRRLNDGWE